MALDNSILKILIHTDTHLGYMERDAHRGADSFAAFEEALYNAKEKKHADAVADGYEVAICALPDHMLFA